MASMRPTEAERLLDPRESCWRREGCLTLVGFSVSISQERGGSCTVPKDPGSPLSQSSPDHSEAVSIHPLVVLMDREEDGSIYRYIVLESLPLLWQNSYKKINFRKEKNLFNFPVSEGSV